MAFDRAFHTLRSMYTRASLKYHNVLNMHVGFNYCGAETYFIFASETWHEASVHYNTKSLSEYIAA
jgi:hypothetical protein